MAKKAIQKTILVNNSPSVAINSTSKTVVINDMTIDNSDVYTFLSEKEDPAKWMEKSIVIGTIGLKQMTIAENVDFVEKEFHKFLADARKAFDKQQETIDNKLKLIFDMKNSDSMIAQFKTFLEEQQDSFDIDNPESLFAKFKEFMGEHQKEFTETVDSTFSVDNKKSQFSKFQAHIDKSLDMEHKDSPLNQFKKLIEEYFDEKDGKIQTVMQSYFDDRKGKMTLLLDKAFDIENKNSSFSKLLVQIRENSDMEEETIKEFLDPNKTDSPIQLLKNSLIEEFEEMKEKELKTLAESLKEIREKDIKELREHILQEEAAAEVYAKGTQKGSDFENVIYEMLHSACQPYEDEVQKIGTGYGGKSKVGDLHIDIDSDINKRIVIECKDSSAYRGSMPKTEEEAKEALSNRNAKYCIFLFKEQSQLPPGMRPITVREKYLITSADGINLTVAYRIARLFVTKGHNGQSEIDTSKLQTEITHIREALEKIDTLRQKVTSIKTAADYLETHLSDLRQNIEGAIGRMAMAISCVKEA